MKRLHDEYGDRVRFVDVTVRQAHPGETRGAYRSVDAKREDARAYQADEGIPWPVLIDDLAGTVHQSYGGMSDPVYLIDATGHVAFYNMWAHAPSVKTAIDALLSQGSVGSVAGGIDRTPHMAASFVNGWRGLRRGGWRSVLEFELATPGAATLTFVGHLAKPVLAPLALRSAPLPVAAKVALGAGATAFGVVLWRAVRRRT